MSDNGQDAPPERVVNTYNGWDPLEEVIVGTAFGATKPGHEPAFNAYVRSPQDRLSRAARRPAELIEAAEMQLDNLARVLEQEGVVVRRPTPTDFFTPVRTPTFEVAGQNASACPRDVLLVIGDQIVEATMGMRVRFFEYLPYRELVREYFNRGARWVAAPKPSMADEMYTADYSTQEVGFDADTHPSLTELEPCFDAASFARIGRDIFYQPDVVTNDFGARWLARHLGPEFRVHRARFKDPHPQHIDATMVPLRPGLVMMNPERPALDDTVELFTSNGWEVVEAVPSVSDTIPRPDEVSNWISMNVFNVDEETIICEEQEEPMIKMLETLGFRVIPLPFRDVYRFGGSFHCCTTDIRRRGGLKSYFPKLDG
ncbi:glycine amidinotransferase [Streptomyces litchfieldiae]|uniref:Glycine amidinotransferase n=1 Tax=Streptomyces litchfieldiae TaxID=3075543 RepID=A0ABU2MRH8_9ACTN|nr:glycine amidinotransferase [Streptomyces sp. DSM 44938]MDT0343963.1 glycine amidinotransferase [Streptomyces sp. DSM 44938]